jgi:hypothetical protein
MTGDENWNTLRKRLISKSTLDEALNIFNLFDNPTQSITTTSRDPGAVIGGAGRNVATPGGRADSRVEKVSPVEFYLAGDGKALRDKFMEMNDEDALELSLGIINFLNSNHRKLACQTAGSTWLSGLIIGYAEPAIDPTVLAEVLPTDASELMELANHVLTPLLLRSVTRAVSTTKAAPLLLKPDTVRLEDRIWETISDLWSNSDSTANRQLIKLFAAAPTDQNSFLRCCVSLPCANLDLFFGEIFPVAFPDEDIAVDILQVVCWQQFMTWLGLPAYYARVLTARQRRGWLASLFGTRGKRSE